MLQQSKIQISNVFDIYNSTSQSLRFRDTTYIMLHLENILQLPTPLQSQVIFKSQEIVDHNIVMISRNA